MFSATWRHYHLTIELLRQKSRDQRAQHLSREFIMRQIETRFLGRLARAVHKQMNDVADFENLSHKYVFDRLYKFCDLKIIFFRTHEF